MLLPDARTGMRVKTRELRRCWLLLCSLTCASLIAVFYRARRATRSQQRPPRQVPKNTVRLKTLLKSLKVPIELRVCAIQCNRPRCPRGWGSQERSMKLIDYIESRRDENLNELKEFLRIPSVSTKSEHKPDIERAAQWVAEKLRAAGLENVEIAPTKMHPLGYGESLHAPGKPTVLVYGHYDVQPAEPLDLWTTPAFEPTIRDGRIYGRGSVDDKGQLYLHVKAIEAHLRVRGRLPVNIVVVAEGEEEVGSDHLGDFVR